MIPIRSRGQVRALLILGFAVSMAFAGDDPPRSKVDRLVLFDGKTLEGWSRTKMFKAGEVRVEDGSIVLEAGGPMTGITTTRPDLPQTDYELRYEARRDSGDDFFAAATFPVGTSFITLVNGGWGGSVTGLSSLNGADASENETGRLVKYQNGTWYKFRIHVTADVIRVWIDDQESIAVNHKDQQVKTRIETRGNQPLGFATYRSKGSIRAVEVRGLKPEEVAANNRAA